MDIGFNKTAIIHSISDTARTEGEIGWINESQLNNTIKEKLPHIKLPKIEVIKKKKIKIGFVSSNMGGNHSVTYFIKDLLD